MRVLVLSHTFPFPPRWGYATRVYHLLRQLALRHDVTLLTYADHGEQRGHQLGLEGVRVEVVQRKESSRRAKRASQILSLVSVQPFSSRAVLSAEMQTAIDRLCARQPFDVIQIEGAVLAAFKFPAKTAVVLDEHNIDYEVFERMRSSERSFPRRSFYWFEHDRFRRFEQRTWLRVSGCVLTSERDARILRAHAPETPTAVVPNGVDVHDFRPSSGGVEPHTILFNGALDYRPNLDAAHYLTDEILPAVRERYPDVRLTIVGRGDPADLARLKRAGAQVTGEVPDLRPHLQRAAVVAVPVRMGGGTRFKVVEGLAMAKPMVSTTIGCEGVDVIDGKHLLIADTTGAFAAQITRVFENALLAETLGRAGRDLVENEYSWDRAGERIQDFYGHIARQRSAFNVERSLAAVSAQPAAHES
ncbi:MAG: glycosyltransferase [Chloroflexi bacterium]|nr:MAG: glycosyltransferase [Chloroflexota bacterium]